MKTKTRIYNQWAGNPQGRQEDLTRCITAVHESGRGCTSSQCRRKRGHGKDGLYCKIHDPEYVARKDAERQKKWDAQMRRDREKWEAPAKVIKLEKKLDILLTALKIYRTECDNIAPDLAYRLTLRDALFKLYDDYSVKK